MNFQEDFLVSQRMAFRRKLSEGNRALANPLLLGYNTLNMNAQTSTTSNVIAAFDGSMMMAVEADP